jgi:hypothetical protein
MPAPPADCAPRDLVLLRRGGFPRVARLALGLLAGIRSLCRSAIAGSAQDHDALRGIDPFNKRT